MSAALCEPAPLTSISFEPLVQSWLAYLTQRYPNNTHKLFAKATIYYRDQSHKLNWLATPSCSDFWTMAKFSDWLQMPLRTAKVRLGLFITIQESWVGRQNPQHKYNYHVWCAALRPAPAGVRGKKLIFWDNEWERTKENMLKDNKRMTVGYALIGGQKKLYDYLRDKGKSKMNIYKIWIGGSGEKTFCLPLSIQWLGETLQSGALDGDLESLGF